MSLPFLGVFLAFLLAAVRMPRAAVLVLFLSVAATVALLGVHATDRIGIDL